MKRIVIGMLALLLSWNVVLGVLGQGILCLHDGLDAHFEPGSKVRDFCGKETSAAGFSPDTCSPCIDVFISSGDFVSVRVTDKVATSASLPMDFAASCTDVSIPVRSQLVGAIACPRAPPRSEALVVRVVRTQVLLV